MAPVPWNATRPPVAGETSAAGPGASGALDACDAAVSMGVSAGVVERVRAVASISEWIRRD